MPPNPKSPAPSRAKEGSLIVFILAVAWFAGMILVGIYLLVAVVKHHTDPRFAGESMSDAQWFVMLATVGIGLGTLFTAHFPARFLWQRNQRRRDRMSLSLSGWTLALLAVELVVSVCG